MPRRPSAFASGILLLTMRSTRFVDPHALPNLLRNGGFDLWSDTDGVFDVPWWEVSGAAPRATGSNAYELRREDAVEDDGASDYARLTLAEDRPVVLRQSLLADEAWAALDFPVPLAPRSSRTLMAVGYASRHERLLPRTRAYTFGAALRVLRGSATVSVRFLDESGTPFAGTDLAALSADATGRRWRRYSATVAATSTPAYVDFYVRRAAVGDFAEVHLGELQLATGAHASAPYTGDRFRSAVPAGAIVLALGEACPPGFAALPDEGSAPNEWAAVGVGPRRGAFPYAAAAADAGLKGAPTHNRDAYEFRAETDAVETFESYEGALGSLPDNGPNGYNPSATVVGDEPTDGFGATHRHNVGDAGSTPAHRSVLLCRKLG